jgi:hypothetical protein
MRQTDGLKRTISIDMQKADRLAKLGDIFIFISGHGFAPRIDRIPIKTKLLTIKQMDHLDQLLRRKQSKSAKCSLHCERSGQICPLQARSGHHRPMGSLPIK